MRERSESPSTIARHSRHCGETPQPLLEDATNNCAMVAALGSAWGLPFFGWYCSWPGRPPGSCASARSSSHGLGSASKAAPPAPHGVSCRGNAVQHSSRSRSGWLSAAGRVSVGHGAGVGAASRAFGSRPFSSYAVRNITNASLIPFFSAFTAAVLFQWTTRSPQLIATSSPCAFMQALNFSCNARFAIASAA